MAAECQHQYNTDFHKTKLLPERGINLDKVEEKFPEFHSRLTATQWMCFAPEPCFANEQWVREFYANLSVVSLANPVMKIRSKQVNFGVEQINAVYGLPNANMEKFRAKGCEPGT